MRCLVVYCHPVPESFGAALRDTAVAALSDRGCDVRLTDLYAEGFDPVLGADERRAMDRAPTDPALAPHIENLRWAQAILFVYPTWWYGLPAMLKGWLDRGLTAFTGKFSALGDLGIIPHQILVLAGMWYACYWLYQRKIFLKI